MATGNSTITQDTFINDAVKAWNRASIDIKSSESIFTAKKLIKPYVKTLPC